MIEEAGTVTEGVGTQQVDLDDAKLQDEIMAPETMTLPIVVDGVEKSIVLPKEPTIGERKLFMRHLSAFASLFNQVLVKRIGVERMSRVFLVDPKNGGYIMSALLEPEVREKATQIGTILGKYSDYVEPTLEQRRAGNVPPKGPTFEQMDDGLGDAAYGAMAMWLLSILNDEVERQKNSSTGAASA